MYSVFHHKKESRRVQCDSSQIKKKGKCLTAAAQGIAGGTSLHYTGSGMLPNVDAHSLKVWIVT